jgi:RNA polymerase sigma-70 factor (ECF subfamily)
MFVRKSISALTDEELLQLFKTSGRNDYFGELFNRYIPLIYGVCLKYMSDDFMAKDAVLQLFDQLLPKIAFYDIAVFRTWLYDVVRNHCLQLIRKQNQNVFSLEFVMESMESDEVLRLLTEKENSCEQLELLKQWMEQLPGMERLTIHLFFMEELSYADISQGTGIPLNQVKSYIQDGKRNLKLYLKKQRK